MNQEQNNFNPNNFNVQGNNEISNNQLFQNSQNFNQGMGVNEQTFNMQSQSTYGYQQPIMQDSVQQSMDAIENGNINNQSFQNNQNSQQVNNVYQQSVQSIQPEKPLKPKKNKLTKILAIIGCIVLAFIILFIVIFYVTSLSSKKLICKSDEGKITIMYNDKVITGYTANGISYDLDGQKKYAEQVGINAYIMEFSTWFKNNTSGSCTIDGKEVVDENEVNSNNENTVVGDNNYGYITIPKKWGKFYDVDGTTSLQYSYANVYIVSLDYFEDGEYTAKDYASNYMYNKLNSSDVTGVTGATVNIGKNKEYTAYQVYMYYPSDGTYLVTYWFEAEDGKVHYIALEGPEELSGVKITDYLYIPESFSLNK